MSRGIVHVNEGGHSVGQNSLEPHRLGFGISDNVRENNHPFEAQLPQEHRLKWERKRSASEKDFQAISSSAVIFASLNFKKGVSPYHIMWRQKLIQEWEFLFFL